MGHQTSGVGGFSCEEPREKRKKKKEKRKKKREKRKEKKQTEEKI